MSTYDPKKLSWSNLTEEVFYDGVPLGMTMEQLADYRAMIGGNILTIIMDRYYEALPEWRNGRLDEIL